MGVPLSCGPSKVLPQDVRGGPNRQERGHWGAEVGTHTASRCEAQSSPCELRGNRGENVGVNDILDDHCRMFLISAD